MNDEPTGPLPDAVEVFPWYKNNVQDALLELAAVESKIPQRLVEVIRNMRDSHLFWELFAAYEAALHGCEGDADKERTVRWTLLARFYIAGSLHRGGPFTAD